MSVSLNCFPIGCYHNVILLRDYYNKEDFSKVTLKQWYHLAFNIKTSYGTYSNDNNLINFVLRLSQINISPGILAIYGTMISHHWQHPHKYQPKWMNGSPSMGQRCPPAHFQSQCQINYQSAFQQLQGVLPRPTFCILSIFINTWQT